MFPVFTGAFGGMGIELIGALLISTAATMAGFGILDRELR